MSMAAQDHGESLHFFVCCVDGSVTFSFRFATSSLVFRLGLLLFFLSKWLQEYVCKRLNQLWCINTCLVGRMFVQAFALCVCM
ncbi:hypothetical protein LguiA_000660 [Lonicera macranthoides]